MHSLRFIHLPHHKFLKKDFLYLSIFLRTFVFISLFTFLPGIIYKDFFHLGETTALLSVSIFFFLYAFVNILFHPFIPYFFCKYGVRSGMVIGLLLTLLTSFFLNSKLYFFAGYLYGALSIFWWVSYNTLVLILEGKGHIGKGFGKSEMFVFLANSLSPFILGSILEKGTFWFYLVTSLLIVITLFFVLKIPRYKIETNIKFEDIVRGIFKYKKELLGFISAGAEGMVFGVYWPLFLYFYFKDFLKLGVFSTMVSFFSALLYYFLGNLIDKKKNVFKYEELGVFGFFASWLGKVIVQSSLLYGFLDIIHKLVNPFYLLPFTKASFDHLKREGILKFVLIREFGYKIGNILSVLVFVFIVFFKLPFVLLFVYAGLISLLPLFVVKRVNKDEIER